MRLIHKLCLAVAAAALLAPCAAQAGDGQQRGWYVGLAGISTFQTDSDSKVDGKRDLVEFDPGWGISGDVGYAWRNGVRTELEIAHRDSDVDKVTGFGSSATLNGGNVTNTNVMLNGFYDFNTGTWFTPYVGLGIGGAFVSGDDIRTVNTRTLNDDEVKFAFQGIAGASAALDRNWALTLDYRYLRTPNVEYKSNLNDTARTENASHNILVGVRYTFNQPEPPPPAPPMARPAAPIAAPAVAPAVPEVPQSFMVFFDFDKSTLTPEAKRILAAASQEFKKGGYVRVVVTGHTDTMGTAKYNQKLSVRRAKSVQTELSQLGVPADVVQAVGAGKTALLVPTADSVREAQNRRAEIVLNK